jgi:ATP-dependent RNA helicase DeaD
MELPSTADINRRRVAGFKAKITSALAGDISFYRTLVAEYLAENAVAPEELAASLALLAQGGRTLVLPEEKMEAAPPERRPAARKSQDRSPRPMPVQLPPEEGMERFRIELGNEHGIKPGNIVGAIANEADLNSRFIGRISIYDTYSTVDLPYGMPEETLRVLHRCRVGHRMLKLQRLGEAGEAGDYSPREAKNGPKFGRGKFGRSGQAGRDGRKPGRNERLV